MCLFELDGIKCGVLICFDLSSIEVIQKVIETQVKVLFVPAAWSESRKWTAFLQVRAMDTHTFVVGVNRARPKERLRLGFGHSMVVNPHGRIIAEVQEDETVLVEEIRIK